MSKGNRVQKANAATWVSLALLFSLDRLVNASLFPVFFAVAPFAKDVGTVAGALVLIALAFVAMRRPFPFVTFPMVMTAAGVAVVGMTGLLAGAAEGSVSLVTASAVLFSVGGRTVVPLYVCFILVKLRPEEAYRCLLAALVVQYPLAWAVGLLPSPAVLLYIAAVPFIASALARKGGAAEMLAGRGGQRLADLSIANPRSFVPFSNIVFVTFALFNVGTGCALTFLSDEGIPSNTMFSVLPAAALLVLGCVGRFVDADWLVKLSYLLTLAGFLVVPLAGMPDATASSLFAGSPALFAAGSSLFTVVFYLVLSEIGRRNRLGAVPLFAFGFGVARIGFEAGTLVGHLMNESLGAAVTTAVTMAFLFAAFGILPLGRVSFQSLVDDVRPVEDASARAAGAAAPLERDLDAQCARAIERYALTPRESEIVRLLAQGRSIAIICEQLVVSKNTVKTHVKNIYLKMDVHSQQELIDRVRTLP